MAAKTSKKEAKAEPAQAKPRAKAQRTSSKAAKKRATFKLDAPQAREVFIAGSFNDWNPSERPLKLAKGVWTTVIMLEPGWYEYRFVVDGQWCDDPKATERKPNEHGTENCVVCIGE